MKNLVKCRFGEKIREIREKKVITLKSLAKMAHVSESLISQIERNKISPSLDTLISIIEILDIDLEYLFQDLKRNKEVSVIKADKRNSIHIDGVVYQQLSLLKSLNEENAIEALYLEIPAGCKKGSKDYGHIGKELGIILEGKGELVYGKNTYLLEKGDSITFSADIPHVFYNRNDSILKAIWVITPPKMIF